jgi:hypothetical protein
MYKLVFSNTRKHTTGVISGIGTGYTSGAPDSPWILMEFVLLNPCVFFSLGHCIACPSAIYD